MALEQARPEHHSSFFSTPPPVCPAGRRPIASPPTPPPLHLGYRCVAVDFFLSPTQIGFTLAQIFQASSEQTTKKFSSVNRKCTPLPQMLKPSYLSWGILGFPRHGVVQPLGDSSEQGSVRTPQVEKEVGTGHLVIPVLSAPTHPGGLEEGSQGLASNSRRPPRPRTGVKGPLPKWFNQSSATRYRVYPGDRQIP